MVNEASEEPPTQRVYLPGSTTHCPFRIPDGKLVLWDPEHDGSCLLRLEVDPRESFERTAGSFDAAYVFAYVELGDLIAFAVARIGDIDSDFYIIPAAGRRVAAPQDGHSRRWCS